MSSRVGVLSFFTLIILCSIETEASTIAGATGSKAMAQLRKDLLRDYDPFSRPCKSNADNTSVKVGVTPTTITRLDEKEAFFYFDAFVKMTWYDSALRWDPASYDGIEVLRVPPNEIWKPDISVYQGQGNDVLPIKATVSILIYSGGNIIWVPPLSIKSLCGDFEYHKFPKDEQTCRVSLGSWTHSGWQIDLQPDNAEDMESLHDDNPTWKYKGMTVDREIKYYPCCPGEPYVTVNYNLTITRRGSEGDVSTTMVRNTLLVLVLAMFWIPATEGGRKIMPGFVALIGHIGLLILSTMVAPSLKVLPYAVLPLKISVIFTSAAVLIELLVLSVINLSVDCPPLAALGSMLNSKAIKILVVNSCRPSDGSNHGPSVIDSGKSSDFKNWPLVATLIDRVSFLIFSVFFVVICTIW